MRLGAGRLDQRGGDAVEELALSHLAYGMRPEDCPAVEAALQAIMRAKLGPACTPELAAALARVHDALAAQVIGAAYDPAPAPDDAE